MEATLEAIVQRLKTIEVFLETMVAIIKNVIAALLSTVTASQSIKTNLASGLDINIPVV